MGGFRSFVHLLLRGLSSSFVGASSPPPITPDVIDFTRLIGDSIEFGQTIGDSINFAQTIPDSIEF